MDTPAFLKRLQQELPRWEAAGLTQPQHRQAILDMAGGAPPQPKAGETARPWHQENKLTLFFYVAGALMVGTGVLLFFAANWPLMPKAVKMGVLFGALWASLAGAGLAFRRNPSHPLGHGLLLLAALLYGADIMLVAQTYHIESRFPNGILAWAVGALTAAWLFRSQPVMILALGLSLTWTLSEYFAYDVYFHWPFLLLQVFIWPPILRHGWVPARRAAVGLFLLWAILPPDFSWFWTDRSIPWWDRFPWNPLTAVVLLAGLAWFRRQQVFLLTALVFSALWMIYLHSMWHEGTSLAGIRFPWPWLFLPIWGALHLLARRADNQSWYSEPRITRGISSVSLGSSTVSWGVFSLWTFISVFTLNDMSGDIFEFTWGDSPRFWLGFWIHLIRVVWLSADRTSLHSRELLFLHGAQVLVFAWILSFGGNHDGITSPPNIPVLVTLLFVAGVALAGWRYQRRQGGSVGGLALSAALGLTAAGGLSLTEAYQREPLGKWAAAGVNGLLFGGLVWLVMAGTIRRDKAWMNIAFAGLAVLIVTRYFDTFFTMLYRSYAMMSAGIVLFAGGWMLERIRRRLLALMDNPPNTTPNLRRNAP
ncbi:MAG: DUF2157 domain-containing protein [Deltaproteobacteria bacterium]|nr:DUF2157 domain-containing protein [Deltaproteobacteria bacterium]